MAARISGGQGSKQTAEPAAQNDGTWPQHPERTLQREGGEWKSLGLGVGRAKAPSAFWEQGEERYGKGR